MGGKKLMTKVRYDMTVSNFETIRSLSQVVLASNENKLLFKARCADLEKLFEDFQEVHVQLAAESGPEFDQGKHMLVFKEISNSYYTSKAKYAKLFEDSELPKATASKSDGSASHSYKPNLLLPKVQIPSFSGKIEEYEYFMDLFLAMVGNDNQLSSTQKIYYLCGALSGEAKSLVQHLSITGENYPVVRDILKSRYGNPRLQADKLLHTMMSASPATKNLGSLKSFLNVLMETSKGLQKLKFPTEEWSYLLLYINLNKLDITLKRQFEDKFGGGQGLPTFENLITFLTKEVQILETTNSSSRGTSSTNSTQQHKVHVAYSRNQTQKQSIQCILCNGVHYLNHCEKFNKLNVAARKNFIIEKRLCFRCFHRHHINECKVKLSCGTCNSRKHHFLLHLDEGSVGSGSTGSGSAPPGTGGSKLGSPNEGKSDAVNVLHSAAVGTRRTVVLSTAVVHILDKYGNYHEVRALLDSGSQSTFISGKCISRLGLRVQKSGSVDVRGVGGNLLSGYKGCVTVRITPRHVDNPVLVTTALVLNKVADDLPSWSLPSQLVDCYPGLHLADDQFYKSAKIDMLIGADLLGDIFLGGEIIRPKGLPWAMNTIFGYILQGACQVTRESKSSVQVYFANTDAILEKFWEVEEVPIKMKDPKEEPCEVHFEQTHQRDATGRYALRLPFLADHPELGDSQNQARRRFHALEKRLQANPGLSSKYVDFMREYQQLGHMVPFSGDLEASHYVIPHHGLFKAGSEKIRVVFDASCPTSTGVSLNDCLHAGPKLQHDVMQVICRFRLHKIAFSTDIRMMYRMIEIQREDQRYQLIFWRESPKLPLQLFALTTVTYGMKCSPYLAIRTLRQLAEDESRAPKGESDQGEMDSSGLAEAARVLQTSVYMDDILSGAPTLAEAQRLKKDIIHLLSLGGFELRKWMSNDEHLLEDIPSDHREKPHLFDTDGPGYVKILGIQWNPFIDESGLLRVGGRLERSSLPFEAKHPVLLPKSHVLTSLIIVHHHERCCHVGATALQAILQKQFWVISARQAIRSQLFKCVKCFRTKAKPEEPFMSDLPADRINATGLFHTVQTDFAGPFAIKSSRLRKAKVLKEYLCVFVCSATKAVHLEVVGDLSTEGFLAAFSRFSARRGLPFRIRSDGGGNYVGSSRHLDEVQRFLRAQEGQDNLTHQAGQLGVIWQFNPPASSHFGGLFESAVKSAKTLLKRVVGDQTLTHEEFVTLVVRIEAVLNSRPLCPLSQDPDQLEALTPAHFIIGRSLLAVPEYDWHHIPDSRLNRYQLVTAMSQRFWLKWSEQYLHTLQMRNKWTATTDPPTVGELVLIKDENLPPLKWRLARINELLPGRDGVVRVVKLLTSTGSLVRPVAKLCRLPLN